MTAHVINRTRTALTRRSLSRPLRLAIEDGLINPAKTVFDYGCGRGDDIRHLQSISISCDGWDPNHKPDGAVRQADVVNLGYVVNVIEDPAERTETLRKAWGIARTLLIVAARVTSEAKGAAVSPYEVLLVPIEFRRGYHINSEKAAFSHHGDISHALKEVKRFRNGVISFPRVHKYFFLYG